MTLSERRMPGNWKKHYTINTFERLANTWIDKVKENLQGDHLALTTPLTRAWTLGNTVVTRLCLLSVATQNMWNYCFRGYLKNIVITTHQEMMVLLSRVALMLFCWIIVLLQGTDSGREPGWGRHCCHQSCKQSPYEDTETLFLLWNFILE